MQPFLSKVIEPFNNRTPISRPQTPMIDESAEENHDARANQHAMTGQSERNEWIKPATRQRLNDLSTFRIHHTELEFPPGGACNSGGNADVAKATYRRRTGDEEQVVAVKKLRYYGDMERKKFGNEFVHEVELMASLTHENIVRLIGFVEDLENGTAWIVMSWEPNGNVGEFLKKGEFEIPERVSLIKDIFGGVWYLHTRKPPICHGDLKSFNILVNSAYRAVITDFGSAREISAPEAARRGAESGPQVQGPSIPEQGCDPIHIDTAGNKLTLTGPAWSLRWAAPEVMNGKRPGLSSDIWAAGWVCWEVMTDKVPFPELNAAGVITLSVINGEVPSPREEGQLGQIMELCSLMTDCWAFDPKARPNVSVCYMKLQWMPSTAPSGGDSSGSKLPSIDLLMKKGRMNLNQSDPQKATVLFQQALDLARSAGNESATADALNGLGDVYSVQSKYSQAEESYTEAQVIYARISNDSGRASTLTGLGHVYCVQAKYIQAEESYSGAQEIYALINDIPGQANTLRGLGEVYRLQSNLSRAAESYTRAEEIYGRVGEDMGRANALVGLAGIYRFQSKYNEAEESYARADEIHARIGNDGGQANALRGLGDVYRAQSKYPQAEDSYARALEIYGRIGDDLDRANTLYSIGYLRRRQGRNGDAAAHFTDARDLYSQIGNTHLAANASRSLAAVLPGRNSS